MPFFAYNLIPFWTALQCLQLNFLFPNECTFRSISQVVDPEENVVVLITHTVTDAQFTRALCLQKGSTNLLLCRSREGKIHDMKNMPNKCTICVSTAQAAH